MNLLLIRHAIAEDRETWAKAGEDDSLRPLTREGQKKFKKSSGGLRVLVPEIDMLLTSPLTRARETAEILSSTFGDMKVTTVAALAPGRRPSEMVTWLKSHKASGTAVLVGHEPDMGALASWFLSGLHESFIEIKKGGAVLIAFEKDPTAGRGKLVWSLTPGQLRRI